LTPSPYSPCSLQIESEQALQDFLVGEVMGPAVGVQDGVIELLMG
jgi:hypothetical protein